MNVGAYPCTRADVFAPTVRVPGDGRMPGLFTEHHEACVDLRAKLGRHLDQAIVDEVAAEFEHRDVWPDAHGQCEFQIPEINRNPVKPKYTTTGECVRTCACVLLLVYVLNFSVCMHA